jgi:hypothetical protein
LPERTLSTIRQYCGGDKVALDALIMSALMYAVAGDKGWADLLMKYGYGTAEPGSKLPGDDEQEGREIVVVPAGAVEKALAELNGEI